MLVPGAPAGRIVRRCRLHIRRDACRPDRPQSSRGVGHHQQHLLAARSLPGADEPGTSRLLFGQWRMAAGPRIDRVDSRSRLRSNQQANSFFAPRTDRRRTAPSAGQYDGARFAQMARCSSSRMADELAGDEPRGKLPIVSRGPAAVARSDVFGGLRRRRGQHRVSSDRPDSHSQTGGARLSPRLGPGARLARFDPVRKTCRS